MARPDAQAKGHPIRRGSALPVAAPRRRMDPQDPHAGPGLEAWGTAGLEGAAQHGPIFVNGTEESILDGGAQGDAVTVGHPHESLRLRLSADARRDLTERRGHELCRSYRAQPCGVIGKDLYVVALSEAAGTTGHAVVLFAQRLPRALPRAGVPNENLLRACEKQRPPLEQQRKRAVSSAEREPRLAHAHLAVRPRAGEHPLRCAGVMLALMEAEARGAPDGD
jgi:hypothetical protein